MKNPDELTAELHETALRWSKRAEEWEALIADNGSYVNHEGGYDRFDATLRTIMTTMQNPRCIDVGCGTGAVSRALLEQGASSVLGIDISEGMIGEARKNSSETVMSFMVTTLEEMRVVDTFDVIASRGVVLSHLPSEMIDEYLSAMTRHSHQGSYAIFDFIQHLDNGGFPNAGNKNVFTFEELADKMRSLGWVPVARNGEPSARVCVAAFHRPFPDSQYFVTSNPQKILELRHATDIEHLHGCDFDITELKHDDITTIASHKASQAFDTVRHPVICTDGGIFFDAYDGFPGPNSKQAAKKLGPAGLLKLFPGTTNRRGSRMNTVAIFDGVTMRTDMQQVPIVIATEPRGTYHAYPMDTILVPIHPDNFDSKTYAEMPPETRVHFTELPRLAAYIKANV